MEPAATSNILAIVGALLVLAALFSPVSSRFGVPVLLLFLVIGMFAGAEGVGGVSFDDYGGAFRLGSVALVLILFDGGLNTSWETIRRVAVPAGILATIGVIFTAALLAGIGVLLGLPLGLSILIGAIVSSTDAAAVFASLRSGGIKLRGRIGSILEVESGINDPMAVVLTMMATEIIVSESATAAQMGLMLVQQLGLGLLGGFAFGYAGLLLLRVAHLPAIGLYPVLTTALALCSFGFTSVVGGSGYLAVFFTGALLGKGRLPYRAGVHRVHDMLAWLSQMLMFLVLGLLVTPSLLLPEALLGLALSLALTFVARPVAVTALSLPFSMSWKERAFASWVGLRGAVPIILAVYPVLRGVPSADRIFHLVFFIVLTNAIVPGATVPWSARRLGLAKPLRAEPPAGIDLVAARDYAGEFVWYQVMPQSAVANAEVSQLPLPEDSLIVLMVRKNDLVPVRGNTRLSVGDHVCVFVRPADRHVLDLFFGYSED